MARNIHASDPPHVATASGFRSVDGLVAGYSDSRMHQGAATLSRGNDTTDAIAAPAVRRQRTAFSVKEPMPMVARLTCSEKRRSRRARAGVFSRWHWHFLGRFTRSRHTNRQLGCQPISARKRFSVACQPYAGSVRVRRLGRLDRAVATQSSPGASMNKPSHVFHERFRMLRARAQFSQGQVADALGVSQNAVGTWERGESQPQVQHIYDMCALFDVSADYLTGRCDNETGLPIGMFMVDMDAAEDPREEETWATQIPQRPALMSYDEVRKIYSEGVKNVKRKGKR